jgi:hypothetical protein
VHAVLHCAPDVRTGVVSMAHGFDTGLEGAPSASTAALVDDATDCEPLSGLPRMSGIPVRVSRARADD